MAGSSGIRGQGTIVRVSGGTPGAPKTISGISKAATAVVTSNAHGLAAGTLIEVDGVVGMVQVNGRAFIVANPLTNSFELKGVNSLLYDDYASSGTVVPHTQIEIGNVTSASLFGGQTQQVDFTNLRSTAREYQPDIPDAGTGSLQLDFNPTDPGQAALKEWHRQGATKPFVAILRTGHAVAFMAQVMGFPTDIQQKVGTTIPLQHTNEPAWYA